MSCRIFKLKSFCLFVSKSSHVILQNSHNVLDEFSRKSLQSLLKDFSSLQTQFQTLKESAKRPVPPPAPTGTSEVKFQVPTDFTKEKSLNSLSLKRTFNLKLMSCTSESVCCETMGLGRSIGHWSPQERQSLSHLPLMRQIRSLSFDKLRIKFFRFHHAFPPFSRSLFSSAGHSHWQLLANERVSGRRCHSVGQSHCH